MPAALAWARDTQQPYKVEILEALRDHGTSRAESREPRAEIDELASEATPGAGSASFYRTGAFTDLCRGPHVPDTSWLTAFRLTHLAGAYWRGDERRPMLQRIYGTAFLDAAGARGSPRPPGRGAAPGPPPAGAGAGAVQHRRRGGRRLDSLASQGRYGSQADRGLLAGRTPQERVRPGLQPPRGARQAVADERAPGLLPGDDVPADGAGGERLLPQTHELPVPHHDLPVAGAELPGPAAPVRGVGDRLSVRAGRRAPRTAAGARLHAGRCAPVLHAGADGRGDHPDGASSACSSSGRSGSPITSSTWRPARTSTWGTWRPGMRRRRP